MTRQLHGCQLQCRLQDAANTASASIAAKTAKDATAANAATPANADDTPTVYR